MKGRERDKEKETKEYARRPGRHLLHTHHKCDIRLASARGRATNRSQRPLAWSSIYMYSWLKDSRGRTWVRLNEIVRIPSIEYLFVVGIAAL